MTGAETDELKQLERDTAGLLRRLASVVERMLGDTNRAAGLRAAADRLSPL